MNLELFPSTLLQQRGIYLRAGKTQASSNRHGIPADLCSCPCHHSLPHTNKSPAFASAFLPGLFKDVSYLTHGSITVKAEGKDSFVSRRHLITEPPTYHISFTGSKLTLDAQMNLMQIHPSLSLCQKIVSICSETVSHMDLSTTGSCPFGESCSAGKS